MESARVEKYLKYYLEALPLGAHLPSTELQPADDLALLAGNTLVNLWTLTHHDAHLLNAVYLLEFGLTKSKQSFLMRLILIRIYRILGKAAILLPLLPPLNDDVLFFIRRPFFSPGALSRNEYQTSTTRHPFTPHSLTSFDLFTGCYW
jgi:N-acetyltransferase B complex (NatB) non catalytic subunit